MAQDLQLANGMSDFTGQDNLIQPEFQLVGFLLDFT